MADRYANVSTVQIVAAFSDGDDRTISLALSSTAANKTVAQLAPLVNEASTYAKTYNVILGDQAKAACTGFKTAKKLTTQTRYLDLT